MTRHYYWDGGAGSPPRHHELGRTDDPRELVPGSPPALHTYAGDLRDAGGTHRIIATALREAPVSSWTGPAADAFIDTAVALVRRYEAAADATRLAARTIDDYADGLAQAQRLAGDAIDLYDGTARHPHADRDPARATSHNVDPQARRDEAREVLERARAHLAALAQDTRIQIRRASDALPASTPLLTPSDNVGSPHTAPASRDTPTPPPGGRTITVRRGDTLSGIAERFLGDASRWPEIAELNRDAIKNPDLIFPGQRLVLPAVDDDDNRRDRDSDDDRDEGGSDKPDRCDDDRHDDDRPPRDSQDDDRYPAPRDTAPRDNGRPPERSDTPPPPTPPPSTPPPSPSPTPTPQTPAPAPQTPAPPTPAPAPASPDSSTTPTPQVQPELSSPQPPPTPTSPDPLPDFYPEPAPPAPDPFDLPDSPPSTSNEPVPDQPAPPPADPEPPPPTTPPTTPPPADPPTAETTPAPAPPEPPTTNPGAPSAPDSTDPDTGGPTPDTAPDGPPDTSAEPDPRSSPSLVANEGPNDDPIDLGTGLFVVGAVGAVAAAVLLARRRDTAERPGTDGADRQRSALPPVVRQLGNAYLARRNADASRGAAPAPSPAPPATPPAEAATPTPPAANQPRFALSVGRTLDGSPAQIDLAATPALALRGSRLADITRAILLACLSPPTGQLAAGPPAHVVIPAADAADLLDDLSSLPTPPGLHIADDIDAALDELERWPHSARGAPPVVLIATAPPTETDTAARLQQILTSRRRVGAVLRGDWPTPATIHATPDAAIHSTTTYPLLPIGTKLFTTPLPDARDLLAALAAPHHSTDPPDPADTHDPPTEPIPVIDPGEPDDERHDNADTAKSAAADSAGGASDEPSAVDHAPDAASDRGARAGVAGTSFTGALSGQGGAIGDWDTDPARVETDDVAGDQAEAQSPPIHQVAIGTDPSRKILTIEVFGRLRVYVNREDSVPVDIAGDLSDRRRELLTYLAVHPAGARRDLIITDLWPNSKADDPTDSLHGGISRLRNKLADYTTETAIILGPEDDHYRLNPAHVDVDYWRFETAATVHHTAPTDTERAEAARHIIILYTEDLAPALTADWIEPLRAHAHRVAIDACDSLARHLYRNGDTDQAIGVLEHATTVIAPYAESLYQLLIQLQRKQGRPKAAERTLEALIHRLAAIDEKPNPATIELVRRV